jgi:hypothetical protein
MPANEIVVGLEASQCSMSSSRQAEFFGLYLSVEWAPSMRLTGHRVSSWASEFKPGARRPHA